MNGHLTPESVRMKMHTCLWKMNLDDLKGIASPQLLRAGDVLWETTIRTVRPDRA